MGVVGGAGRLVVHVVDAATSRRTAISTWRSHVGTTVITGGTDGMGTAVAL